MFVEKIMLTDSATVSLESVAPGTTLVVPYKPDQLYMKVTNYPSQDPTVAFIVRVDSGFIDGIAKNTPVVVVYYKAVKEQLS